MQDFLVHSLIASVVLTVLLNLLPRLFPNQSRKVERKIHQQMEDAFNEIETSKQSGQPRRSRVKVFFPWKAMLAISIGLTLLVNIIGFFMARGG